MYKYRCKKCDREWESEIGALQMCEKCERICEAYEQPKRDDDIYVNTRIFADNKHDYSNDPMGWKRAGYVSKTASWNSKLRRYEVHGDPRKALTRRGKSRATRSDLNK